MPKHIFVMALDDFNLEMLKGIRGAEQFRFHCVLSRSELVRARYYPMDELLARAGRQLHEFPETIAGLISYWDFPSSTMAAVLRRRFKLIGPSLESVLCCEHKYWSRLVQQQVVPELVPRFCSVDPYATDSLSRIDLPFPFWLKPVRAHSSHLGYRIADEGDYRHAISEIRERLPRFAEPFNTLLSCADLPPAIAAVDGYHCVAEEIIEADAQCTLEGYVYQGQPRIYGIVDSSRDGHFCSFSRYQYPSSLPRQVQQRMVAAAEKVMRHIDYDNGPFNMEFFYAPSNERLSLLEINARISKSHCPLFAMVEGVSHHEVAVYLAIGKEPRYPPRKGSFGCAAKFMLRRFEDARVLSVPSCELIRRLEDQFKGSRVCVNVKVGDRLSELRDQDSYSYEYAVVFLGGRDLEDVERTWDIFRKELTFTFAAVLPEEKNDVIP